MIAYWDTSSHGMHRLLRYLGNHPVVHHFFLRRLLRCLLIYYKARHGRQQRACVEKRSQGYSPITEKKEVKRTERFSARAAVDAFPLGAMFLGAVVSSGWHVGARRRRGCMALARSRGETLALPVASPQAASSRRSAGVWESPGFAMGSSWIYMPF